MKNYLLCLCVLYILCICDLYAEGPSETCPENWMTLESSDVILASETCPSGYVQVGDVESCLVSEVSGCALFVPAGVAFTDETGSYSYTDFCAYGDNGTEDEEESSS